MVNKLPENVYLSLTTIAKPVVGLPDKITSDVEYSTNEMIQKIDAELRLGSKPHLYFETLAMLYRQAGSYFTAARNEIDRLENDENGSATRVLLAFTNGNFKETKEAVSRMATKFELENDAKIIAMGPKNTGKTQNMVSDAKFYIDHDFNNACPGDLLGLVRDPICEAIKWTNDVNKKAKEAKNKSVEEQSKDGNNDNRSDSSVSAEEATF